MEPDIDRLDDAVWLFACVRVAEDDFSSESVDERDNELEREALSERDEDRLIDFGIVSEDEVDTEDVKGTESDRL